MGAGSRQLLAGADLATLGKRLVERALERCRKVTVARVLTFSRGPHPTVSVQPLIPRFVDDADPIRDPQLDGVPVLFPGSSLLRIDWRLYPGDLVLVLTCDRPIDDIVAQLDGPQAVAPQVVGAESARLHDLSDSFAVPVATYGNPLAPSTGPTAIPGSPLDLLEFVDTLLSALQSAAIVPMAVGAPTLNLPTQTILAAMRARLALLL